MSEERERAPPRLFVDAPLGAGGEAALSANQAHYLRHVLRRGEGDPVILFNGHDGEWRGRIAALGKARAAVAVEMQTRRQEAEPDLWLLFAPIKRGPVDLVAEKATELGVSALVPVVTRRTVVGRVNTERLRAIAMESAEQCHRLNVPEVREPRPLAQVLDAWPDGRRLLLCDETGQGRPLAQALAGFDAATRQAPWAVLVGPEGGFDPAELDAIKKRTIVTSVTLGRRLLRAETAAMAALACWQALVGDWT
ncbi:MAG: 16S rRNA (uracil(1498)-N(3))-methyltransferase [Alphaproteobacteria bacterium]